MPLRIIIDSTADLPPARAAQFTVIPMTIRFGEEEFVHGVDITNEQFYRRLLDCQELPTTSQVSPFQFGEVFRQAVEAGDSVVAITLSSKLSGTYQSAVMAAADFPGRVFVVDSTSVSVGTSILAELALELAQKGLDAEAVAAELTAQRENICIVAMLDTLKYLQMGGRISKTTAIAGDLLGIKPVVGMGDGAVQVLGKARGIKQANSQLIQQIEANHPDPSKPLLLGYTGLEDTLLQKFLQDSGTLWPQHPPTTLIGSVVGTHVGPGAVAAAFFRSTGKQ